MITLTDSSVPVGLVRAAVASWPATDWLHWHLYDSPHDRKYATKDPDRLPTACRLLVEMMASRDWAAGFPDMDLHAAGMGMLLPGGFVGRHADAAAHPLRPWRRVASSVLFLTSCGGGRLLIDGEEPVVPYPGRLVTFDGQVPHSVETVASGRRLSLNLFWWREQLPGEAECLSTRAVFMGGQ